MNITSTTDFNEKEINFMTQNNDHVEGLRQTLNSPLRKAEGKKSTKSKSTIRIKQKTQIVKVPIKKEEQKNSQIKYFLNQKARTLVFPPSAKTGERQLHFLRDIVSRKKSEHKLKSQKNIETIQQQRQIKKLKKEIKDLRQEKLIKQAKEAQQIKDKQKQKQKKVSKTRLINHSNNQFVKFKDYDKYDMVVKDILSQIKIKKQRTKKSKSNISPSKNQRQRSKEKERNKGNKFENEIGINEKIIQKNNQEMIFRNSSYFFDSVYEKKITSYTMFLYKINLSNSIYVDLSLSQEQKIYKVKIQLGNNGYLIRSLLKRRFWLQVTNNTDEASFIWTQNSESSIFSKQLSNEKVQGKPKSELFLKKAKKYQRQRKNEQIMLNEKILSGDDIYEAQVCYNSSNNCIYSIYPHAHPSIVSNHIPHNYYIGSKKILFLLLSWYYTEVKFVDPFLFLPKTYHIRSGQINNAAFKKFKENQGKNLQQIWIVKPGENTNQGNGITVASYVQIGRIIRKKQLHKNGQEKTYIIQQYIKPFLYHGRKFDIRHFLLITSVNGYIKAYWFKSGYIRTSSEPYDLQDLSNEFVHLTNDSIQKKSELYGKYEPGNKLTYYQFQRYLDSVYPHKKYSFQNQILSQMKQITKDVMYASFNKMDPQRKDFNFELYGMDFIIDHKFKPYLIQVNANPCLSTSCPILQRIIPVLAQHTLRLALDPLFPPPSHYSIQNRYNLSDRILQKIKYQIIFDQKHEGQQLLQIFENVKEFQVEQKGQLRADEQLFDDNGQELNNLVLD